MARYSSTNNYPLLSSLIRVCEYAYRKGVADAASCGDTEEVMSVADRADNHTSIRFLRDEGGRVLSWEFYQDWICLVCGRIDAGRLRAFMATEPAQESMKRDICTPVDDEYRRGLRVGCSIDKNRAVEFMEKVGKGNEHKRLTGKTLSQAQYVDEIKAMVGQIHNIRRGAGRKSTLPALRRFIAQALLKYKEEKETTISDAYAPH
jgi:hypothetical protein